MLRRNCGLAFMTIFGIFGACTTPAEPELLVEAVRAKPFKADAGQVCFDVQMDVWMDNFQSFQQNGLDMYAADTKARDLALKAFDDCHARKSEALAAAQARKY
jgi:hypothetical protein